MALSRKDRPPGQPSAARNTQVQILVTPLLGASMSSPPRSPGQGVKGWNSGWCIVSP